MAFLRLGQDIILMEIFIVVCGGQLVDDTCNLHHVVNVSSPYKNT